MEERLKRLYDRGQATRERFLALSRQYWWAYILASAVAVLATDALVGWTNHQISRFGLGVVTDIIVSPILLPMLVVCVLLVLAYFDLPRPSALNGPPMPEWLEKVLAIEPADLQLNLHMDGDQQHGHVRLNLDAKRKPSISFSFVYVNTSIDSLLLTGVSGPVTAEHEEITGYFEFTPLEVPHNSRFVLRLLFVISTDASRDALRELAATGAVHFELDTVKVALQTKHGDGRQSDLRFPQQYWSQRDQV